MKCQAEILQHEVVITLKVNMTKFNIEILEGLCVSCLLYTSLCNDVIYRKARVHCSLAILKNQLYFRSQSLLLLAPAEGNVFSFKMCIRDRRNRHTRNSH